MPSIVLMYHFVHGRSKSLLDKYNGVTLDNFEQQLNFLCEKYTPLTHADFSNSANNGDKIHDHGFYLTFDDGTKDHIDNVLPILLNKGITASFFPVTQPLVDGKVSIVEKQRFLQYIAHAKYSDFIEQFCMTILEYMPELKPIIDPSDKNILQAKTYLADQDFYSNEERFYRKIRNEYIPVQLFNEVISNEFSTYYYKEDDFVKQYYMDASDIAKLHNSGMTIGGHSHTHPVLTQISNNDIEKEVKYSLDTLKTIVGNSIESFAYPFGIDNQFTVKQLIKNEVKYSFIVGNSSVDTSDPYKIPRIDSSLFDKILSY